VGARVTVVGARVTVVGARVTVVGARVTVVGAIGGILPLAFCNLLKLVARSKHKIQTIGNSCCRFDKTDLLGLNENTD